MLGPSGARLSTTETLDLLSLTGGVPKYLEEISPELSVDENFRRLCFLPRSLLFREKAGHFEFVSLEQLNGWDSILGLQFENLVLNHVGDLFPHLGLERSLVLSAAPYVQNATKRIEGCQIDLLIRTERMLMVVEIKRRREIRHEVVDEVAEKIRKLKYDRRLSIRTALVYDGLLSPSVEADRFFDFIVPADILLKHP